MLFGYHLSNSEGHISLNCENNTSSLNTSNVVHIHTIIMIPLCLYITIMARMGEDEMEIEHVKLQFKLWIDDIIFRNENTNLV